MVVSIPVRVLGVLEPYRSSASMHNIGFNPCKGFGGFGTYIQFNVTLAIVIVSIPVRVLGVLEP